jgi:hypothetical protein
MKMAAGGGELSHLELVDAVHGAVQFDLLDPVEDVLAAASSGTRKRKMNLATGRQQILGDLTA